MYYEIFITISDHIQIVKSFAHFMFLPSATTHYILPISFLPFTPPNHLHLFLSNQYILETDGIRQTFIPILKGKTHSNVSYIQPSHITPHHSTSLFHARAPVHWTITSMQLSISIHGRQCIEFNTKTSIEITNLESFAKHNPIVEIVQNKREQIGWFKPNSQ